jgi:phosphoglycolate phosphatase
MYPLVIFDFDGTLVDSLAHSIEVFQRIAPQFKLKLDLTLETARTTPTRQLFKQMGVSFWKLPRLIRTFQEEASQDAERLALFAGISPTIQSLAARGTRLGILSSNREDAIRRCLRTHNLEQQFAFVVGYPKLFGKAKALRRIIKAERVERSQLLYVGDETRDIEAARKAKIASAAATWGFHAESLLATAQPTYLVRKPEELLAIRG